MAAKRQLAARLPGQGRVLPWDGMNVNTVRWLGAAAVLTLVGVAGALGHVVLASEVGALSYLVLACMAALLGLGLGHAAVEVTRRHQQEIERRNEELSALNAVAVTASHSLDLTAVLHDCLDKTLEVMKLDAGAVFYVSEGGTVALGAQQGLTEGFLGVLAQSKIGENVSGSVIVPDRSVREQAGANGRLCASVSVPLRSEGQVVGAMHLFSKAYRAFGERDVQILVSIGDVIGMAVRNAKLHAQVMEHAARDGLTGLFNRRHFDAIYAQEVERSRRYGTPLTVAMIDIDGFKAINDSYGHAAGDRALEAIAGVLRDGRASDITARYGGDEFVILMPNTDLAGARAVAGRIRRAARSAVLPDVLNGGLSLSIGLADSGLGYDDILRRADADMYAWKRRHASGLVAA